MNLNEAKFTKGPWHIGTRSGFNACQIKASNGKDEQHDTCICEVSGLPLYTKLSEMEVFAAGDYLRTAEPFANARLIACAPELLEALMEYSLPYSDEDLQSLADCTTGMGEVGPDTARREIKRRAALAKAIGTNPE